MDLSNNTSTGCYSGLIYLHASVEMHMKPNGYNFNLFQLRVEVTVQSLICITIAVPSNSGCRLPRGNFPLLLQLKDRRVVV